MAAGFEKGDSGELAPSISSVSFEPTVSDCDDVDSLEEFVAEPKDADIWEDGMVDIYREDGLTSGG